MAPIRRVRPGQRSIPADDLNRAFAEADRASKMATSRGLAVRKGPNGPMLRLTALPGMWVRVTGKEFKPDGGFGSGSGSGSGSGGADEPCDNFYSGVQLVTKKSNCAAEDADSGVKFFVDDVPLVEVTGNAGVPDDTIVRAFPGDTGDHWAFEYFPRPADAGSGTGTGTGTGGSGSGGCDPVTTGTLTFHGCDGSGNSIVRVVTFPFDVSVCETPNG